MQAFLHLEYNFVSFSEKQTFVTYGIDNILTTRSFSTQLIVSVNMYSISFFPVLSVISRSMYLHVKT